MVLNATHTVCLNIICGTLKFAQPKQYLVYNNTWYPYLLLCIIYVNKDKLHL